MEMGMSVRPGYAARMGRAHLASPPAAAIWPHPGPQASPTHGDSNIRDLIRKTST